ncbi:MAG: LytTR family DNA-binding domain-containing protein [Ferruginibacter sp.]
MSILSATINSQSKLTVALVDSMLFLSPGDIIRLEAKSNYTKIFLHNKPSIITSKVLKEYEPLLKPFGFIRTHRSHLINKNRVIKIDNKNKILMDDTFVAAISRNKRAGVMKELMQ